MSFVEGYYLRFGNYKAATNPYYSQSGWSTCETLCDNDYLCNGYSIDAYNNLCYLSSCTNYTSVPACPLCLYAMKISITSPDLCWATSTTTPTTTTPMTTTPTTTTPKTTTPMTTTTLTTTTTPTTSVPSTENVTYNVINTTSCICICTEVNQSLEVAIQNRREELTVNPLKLASTTRKRTSAQDIRVTSKVIGTVAILILVGFGLFFFLGDLVSVFCLIFTKNVIIQKEVNLE